jgi:hypothetical protein
MRANAWARDSADQTYIKRRKRGGNTAAEIAEKARFHRTAFTLL